MAEFSKSVKSIFNEFDNRKKFFESWQEDYQESYNYYKGKQWSNMDKNLMDKEGRPPPFAINKIHHFVNTVTGWQRQSRVVPKAYPEKNSSNQDAHVITQLLRHIYKNNRMHEKEARAFQDSVISGRGGWTYDIVTDRDGNDTVEINWDHQLGVYPDPTAMKYYGLEELEKHESIYRSRWLTKTQLMNTYPDHKNHFKHLTNQDEDTNYDFEDETDREIYEDNYDKFKGTYRVIEKYTLMVEIVKYYVLDNQFYPVGESKKDPEEIATQIGAEIVSVRQKVLYMTTIIPSIFADKPIINNQRHHIQNGHYPFVLFGAYDAEGDYYGVVRQLRPLQEWINKRAMQIIEIMAKAPNGLLVYEEGIFSKGTDDAKLNFSKPGGMLEIKRGKMGRFQYLQQNQVPSGAFQLEEQYKSEMSEVSGIFPSFQGQQESANESGKAIEAKVRQTVSALQILWDRFDMALDTLAKHIIDLIPEVYTQEYIFHVLDVDNNDQEEVVLNQRTVGGLLNDVTDRTKRFNVQVDHVDAKPTLRLETFKYLSEIMKMLGGDAIVTLMPELIRWLDIPNKEKIAKSIKEYQQAQAQAAQQQAQAAAQVEDRELQTKEMRAVSDAKLRHAKTLETMSNMETQENERQMNLFQPQNKEVA